MGRAVAAAMLGVSLDAADLPFAREFFELFKTPWEPVVRGRRYAAVISAGGARPDVDTNVMFVYGSRAADIDRELGLLTESASCPADVMWDGSRLPIYGRVATFRPAASARLIAGDAALDSSRHVGGRFVRRIGYDLFGEVRRLLTSGQPASNAEAPTLELHIELLRRLLVDAGVPFVEVPPRPYGYRFTCCLTHDIDFCGIRRHRFDRTLAGFVTRASVGTLIDLCRGRRSARDVARNFGAFLSLPFVFAGVAPDFWRPFDDYARSDEPRKSTFFLVPFRAQAGVAPDGTVDSVRAVPYQVSDVRQDAKAAAARGSELAVHGIDAWRDVEAGRAEMTELTSLTDRPTSGIRMHWLYFSPDSPRRLEAAGYDYDSTWGYNDAVGYRAGTSQVFRMPGCDRLMELPLSIMDTALLFSDRMGLGPAEALDRCDPILKNAKQFGGTLVVNWHDRSLVPERLWDGVYRQLLDAIGTDEVWFATAQEAVDWFRWRRTIRFGEDGTVSACERSMSNGTGEMPPALLRVHRPAGAREAGFEELRLSAGEHLRVPA
jgi:hypothetical protein